MGGIDGFIFNICCNYKLSDYFQDSLFDLLQSNGYSTLFYQLLFKRVSIDNLVMIYEYNQPDFVPSIGRDYGVKTHDGIGLERMIGEISSLKEGIDEGEVKERDEDEFKSTLKDLQVIISYILSYFIYSH